MSAPVFVDTNVLVYARDATEREKQPVAARWLEGLWQARLGRLSIQVLQEYYVAVTTKLKPGLDAERAREDVRALFSWRPVVTSPDLVETAWMVQTRFGFAFWDALVVAAAQRAGCAHLLTEDLQDGQVLDGVTVVNPFQRSPEAVLD
jgi:predicted nucleic acid-binding protein